ncbi:MAG: M14 family metallopeptidase, partial [Bacteroidia bacterium]|nr:M14 family metallopeptidase [Bacteroidia bacterium]
FYLFVVSLVYGSGARAQKVPIAFDKYHGFTGTESYLKAVAKAYPDITELKVIGKSTMGRQVYVLIISNTKTGTPLDRFVQLRNPRKEPADNVPPITNDQAKPGHWICGSTHGNEFTGTEVCLYTIDKLITGYGSDPEITDLIDQNAFYICPVVNPDGVYNSVEKDLSQRGNSLMKDDDNDGKINEDGPDDLDGDGRITSFRYMDPKGQYLQDEVDPRVMIRIGEKEKTEKQRWSVIREDKDNDGDKKRGEDSEEGFDLNRNFPEVWFDENGYQGGTGDYPTSAPEVQALAEFFSTHHNILMAQFYHTSGGFTCRPMGASSDVTMHPKDIAVYDLILGKKYVEMMGDDMPKAWMYPDSISDYKKDLETKAGNKFAAARGYEMPRTWVVSYNEKENKRYGFGLQSDWAYQEMGIYSITTELFNYRLDLPGNTFTGDDAYTKYQRAALIYQEEKAGGAWFQDWKPYKHPELGDGEIGGWYPQYQSNAFPGEILEKICETHWLYEKYRASLLPHVIVVEAKGKEVEKAGSYRIVEVTAKVENTGKLATNLARGSELPGNRPDVVWLIGDRDKLTFIQGMAWQKAGVLEGTMPVPGYPPGKTSNELKWMVKVKGNTPLKVVVSSMKGGTDAKEVTIN